MCDKNSFVLRVGCVVTVACRCVGPVGVWDGRPHCAHIESDRAKHVSCPCMVAMSYLCTIVRTDLYITLQARGPRTGPLATVVGGLHTAAEGFFYICGT